MEISKLLSLGTLWGQHVYERNMEIYFLGMDLLVLSFEFTLQGLFSGNGLGAGTFRTPSTVWRLVSRGHAGAKLSFLGLGVWLASASCCCMRLLVGVCSHIQLFALFSETESPSPGLVITSQLISWPEQQELLAYACRNAPVQSAWLFSCWLTFCHGGLAELAYQLWINIAWEHQIISPLTSVLQPHHFKAGSNAATEVQCPHSKSMDPQTARHQPFFSKFLIHCRNYSPRKND